MEPNTTPSPAGGEPQPSQIQPQMSPEAAEHEKSVRLRIGMFGFFLFIVFIVGLFWMFTNPNLTVGLTLSFVAGLSMIFLPCTLPLAFVIVPLTLGKEPKKGLIMAMFFGLGLTITLSLYGVFIAALGKTFGLKSDVEVYAVLFGGAAALLFGLSEIGLLNFKLPSYSGKFPDFIQRQRDYVKTFLLGLLLGNAGVGCPNPAFYVLLGYIATTADLFNGWILGFVHGLGRTVPLLFLAILGTLGVNALSGIAKHKEAVERAMGWALVIIGTYLFTFGIFGHDWFTASGLHSSWESFVNSIGGEQFGEIILKHEHTLIDVPNLIQYGNMFFLGLLALIMSTAFVIKRPSRRTMGSLAGIYFAIVLLIGFSTGWTFRIGTGIHVSFQGEVAAPHGEEGGAVFQEESETREGLAVNLNAAPFPVLAGRQTRLDFFVNEKPGNVPVPSSDLEVDQTKLMHVIGVRDDLNEFFHIHPNPVRERQGILSVDYKFLAPGIYKIWSEIKKDGVNYAFGHPEFSVDGAGERLKKEIFYARSVIAGNYQVLLDYDEPVVKGRDIDLDFDIHDVAGREVEVEPYLAADIHLSVIKEDLERFIHTHPEGGEEGHMGLLIFEEARANGEHEEGVAEEGDKTINFHVNFPDAGNYKLFAQFRPKGIELPPDEALLAAFWIKVEERSPLPISGWWINLLWASIAIVLLGWGVNRYLRVKT